MRALSNQHRYWLFAASSLALSVACSVFPDDANLPTSGAGFAGAEGNDGGAVSGKGATRGGSAGAAPTGGTASAGASTGGGDGGKAGAANGAAGNVAQGGQLSQGGDGGQGAEQSGQAGMGGVDGGHCENPVSSVITTTLDAWIGSASPSLNHGDESLLYVSGGSDERRALFKLTMPAELAGAQPLRAEIVLSLESNADTSKAIRKLVLRRLQSPGMREDKVTWTHFAQGNNNTWNAPGGDLGEVLGERTLPPGTTSGLVGFDVLGKLQAGTTYEIAVLEAGSSPQAPAEMAFTSRESHVPGSPAPELRLSYCPP